jgi:hypothetical protein
VVEAVYVLCGLTSLLCAILLLRGYARSRTRLLLWSGLCFAGLTLNNVLLFIDMVALPETDLSSWRMATVLLGLLPLLYGVIWDAEG